MWWFALEIYLTTFLRLHFSYRSGCDFHPIHQKCGPNIWVVEIRLWPASTADQLSQDGLHCSVVGS